MSELFRVSVFCAVDVVGPVECFLSKVNRTLILQRILSLIYGFTLTKE
jgi:hypothetical protein